MPPRIIDVRTGFARSQIVIGESITVVDAEKAAPILEALAQHGIAANDVRRIVITHGDPDHWRGAMALREASGAQIAAHESERTYLEGSHIPPFPIPKRLLLRFGPRGLRRPVVDHWLRDGEALDDGITVVHTPGHTPGHICLAIGDALIAGDAFRTGDRFSEVPRMMTSDARRARESIRALATRDVARAFSGHGPPSDGAGEKLRALAGALPPG